MAMEAAWRRRGSGSCSKWHGGGEDRGACGRSRSGARRQRCWSRSKGWQLGGVDVYAADLGVEDHVAGQLGGEEGLDADLAGEIDLDVGADNHIGEAQGEQDRGRRRPRPRL